MLVRVSNRGRNGFSVRKKSIYSFRYTDTQNTVFVENNEKSVAGANVNSTTDERN